MFVCSRATKTGRQGELSWDWNEGEYRTIVDQLDCHTVRAAEQCMTSETATTITISGVFLFIDRFSQSSMANSARKFFSPALSAR
jgi:hypothetical protein